MAMFYFKKLVGGILLPIPLCCILFLIGLLLLWLTKRQKTGKTLVTLGTVLLMIAGCHQVAALIMAPLENAYPPTIDVAALKGQNAGDPTRWIVVLGGGYNSDASLPLTSQVSDASLIRLVEGIRLHRLLPGTKLVLSEGSLTDPIPGARLFSQLAQQLGVDEKDIVLDTESVDTKDQAILIERIVGKDRFILVTSADHMWRSMALFRKRGMQPIAVPTDHSIKQSHGSSPTRFMPGSNGLLMTERSIHEYLGLVWAKMRGQI